LSNSDTTNLFFDPLGEEWTPGKTDVQLDSNKWQKITYPDIFGTYFLVHEMEPFGFTIQNATLPSQGNDRMEIYSKSVQSVDPSLHFSPYHSIKFYNSAASTDSTIGWQIRDYEWGMYVVASVSTDGPLLVFNFLDTQTPIQSGVGKKISATIKNFGGPAQPTTIKEAFLKYKIGFDPIFSTLPMSASNDTFSTVLPPLPEGKQIYMYIVVNDMYGNRMHSNISSYSTVTTVQKQNNPIDEFTLSQNYPNPFNPATTISFALPVQSFVSLKIFDLLGREVATLVSEKLSAGTYTRQWNAANVASGFYFYRLRAGNSIETKKMIFLK